MNTPAASSSRWILVLASLGLASLLGGCGLFNSGPNVIHVGSGLQWDTHQLGRPATGQSDSASLPSSQPTAAVSETAKGG
jgi:hypothetical protein